MSAVKYDLIVVGSGPSGQRAAVAAAKMKKRVCVVEARAVVGGVCVNTGTIPSKTMREAVLHLSGYNYRSIYGINYRVKEKISMADLAFRVRAVIKTEVDVTEAQLSRNGIDIVHGVARFIDPHTLRVEGPQTDLTLAADRIILAVGTKPASSTKVPINGRTIVNSDQILGLTELPRTLIVVGRWPERIYGDPQLQHPERSRVLLDELEGGIGPQAQVNRRRLGRGQVIWAPDERGALSQILAESRPDVRLEPRQPEVGVVCRCAPRRDIYFLANVSDRPQRFAAGFRTTQEHAERWDPMTGRIERLRGMDDRQGFRRVAIDLPPRGSTFVVWGGSGKTAPQTPPFTYEDEPLNMSWTLSFEGDNAPAKREINELVSWTTWPDAKFISGRGVYTGKFVWNRPVPQRAWLKFSRVAEVAEVSINGHKAGVVWTPPAETDISGWLQAGTNSLVVTVANLPLNGFLGAPEEDLRPLRAAYVAPLSTL